MKSEKLDFVREVMIARHHWDVPVRVGLRPYMEFSRQMDDELRELVARWKHAAAPDASGRRQRRK